MGELVDNGAAVNIDSAQFTASVATNYGNGSYVSIGRGNHVGTAGGTTYDNFSTLLIKGPQYAGSNMTFTNSWAVYVNSGMTRLSGLKLDIGSDATGDIFYRNSSGNITRLGIGSAGQFLQVSSGLPSWQTLALSGSVTHDFGTIPNNSSATTTVSVTGAVDGDFVVVTKPIANAWSNGESYTAWVSGPDQVTVRQNNNSGGSAGFGSQTINVKVIKQ
jgi:hypothetical protein